MAVHSALRNEPARVSEIEIRLEEQGAEVPHATLYNYLDNLVTVGLARKEGSGGQRDPSRYAHVDPPGARGTDNPTSPVVGQSETCPRQADKDSQPVDEHEDTLSEEHGPKTGENLSACQDPYRPTTDKLSTADADRLAADLDAHLDRARAEEAR
jgi:hypothetical protein